MATVSKTTRSASTTLASASAGPFDVGIRLFDTDSLEVYVNGSIQATGWTLSATFEDGFTDAATVTFDESLASADVVYFQTALTPNRGEDYLNGDPLLTGKLNIELARIWSALGDLFRDSQRSVRFLGGDTMPAITGTSGQALLIGADGNPTAAAYPTDNSEDVYRDARTTANATAVAALSDGTLVWLGQQAYYVDSSATGSDSVTNDLGVDGLVPAGNVYFEHFGAVADADPDPLASRALGTDNTNACRAAVAWAVPRREPIHLIGAYRTDGLTPPSGTEDGSGERNPSLSIIGRDATRTGLVFTGSATAAIGIAELGGTPGKQYIGGTYSNFFMYGPGDPDNDMHGLCLVNQRNFKIENVQIYGFAGDCEPLWIYARGSGGSFNGEVDNVWVGYLRRPNDPNDSDDRRTYNVQTGGDFWKMNCRRGPLINGYRGQGGANDHDVLKLNVHGFFECGLQMLGHGGDPTVEGGAACITERVKIYGKSVIEDEIAVTAATSTTVTCSASLVNDATGDYNNYRVRLDVVNGNDMGDLVIRQISPTGDVVAGGNRTLTVTAAWPTYDDLGFNAFGGGAPERPSGALGTDTALAAGDEVSVIWGDPTTQAKYDTAEKTGLETMPVGVMVTNQDRLKLGLRQIESTFQAVLMDEFSIEHDCHVEIQGSNSNYSTGVLCLDSGTTTDGIKKQDLLPTISGIRDITHGKRRFTGIMRGLWGLLSTTYDDLAGYRGFFFEVINDSGGDLVEGDCVVLKTSEKMKINKKIDGTFQSAAHVYVVVHQKDGGVYADGDLVQVADINSHVPVKTWGEIERDCHLVPVSDSDVSGDADAAGRLKMWLFTGTHDGTAFTNATPSDIDGTGGVRNYLESPEVWPPAGQVVAIPIESYNGASGDAAVKVCRIIA